MEKSSGMKKLTIIGAGNVATHLAAGLCGIAEIIQIYSRNLANACALSQKTGCGEPIDSVADLKAADVYLIAIKDDAIAPLLASVPDHCKDALWLHTSGSVGKTVFSGFNNRHGVFYPLQTFSIGVELNLHEIPFFIEGSSVAVTKEIAGLAELLSRHVYEADSALRMKMHIAAVFSCNFSNYMQIIADDILKRNNLPFSVLQPLIRETTRKIMEVPPEKAQTGPAARGDREIIAKHLSMLSGEEKEIYETMSNAILKHFRK